MNSVLDSTLSTLEDALPNIIGVCFHEDVPLHTLKTAPTDRSARKRDLQAAIADVDQTIASVRAIHDVVALMLNTLQRKKASLHHALLSPVYALPTELLQRVFSMLAVEAGGSDVVIALTNVCSSWRSAALGSGRLWGQVKVRNVSMLSELVTRSAPHQFSLELQLPLGLSRESSEPPMICLEPQAARRLSSLTLADSSILRRLEFPDSTLLSSLQTLQLNGGLSLDHDNLPSLPSAFNCISKLIIHNWDRPRCLMNNALWPNLTTIFFQNSSAVSVANVLGNMAAPRLINLSFAKMTNGFWTVGFNAIVSPPPNVRSINIVDSSHFIDTFASNFRLFPNLKSLALVRLDEERGCDWDMLLGSLPNVTNLSIIHRPDNLDGLVELAVGLNGVDQVPSLEVLTITRLFDVPVLLDGLANLSNADRARILRRGKEYQDTLDDPLPFVDDTNPSTNPVAVALADVLHQRMQDYLLPRLRRLVISHSLGGGDSYFFWGLADVVTLPTWGPPTL